MTAKRLQIIAQGFSPGLDMTGSSALKALPIPRGGVQFGEGNPRTASRVAPECRCLGTGRSICNDSWPQIGCPFRAYRTCTLNPGLKPWAIIFCPSRAKDVVTAFISNYIAKLFSLTPQPLTQPLSLSCRIGQFGARPEYHREIAGRTQRMKWTSETPHAPLLCLRLLSTDE
jgi:hypothetical protein